MINKVYQNDTCWLDYQYCSGRWHILGNTLLQSAVCCGTAMAEVMKDLLLSPGNNQDGPVNSEIQYLESKYPSSIDGINLRMEMRSLQGLKKAMPRISTKDFMGVLVASYSSLVPQCSKIATLYLIAPIQNAVVESFFPTRKSYYHFQKIPYSHQNSWEKGPRQILRQLVLWGSAECHCREGGCDMAWT